MATAPTSTRSRRTSRRIRNVVYNATLTHRVGFEIRGLAQANNADYTFQPSTGATTGIFSREIVETATCDNCHTMLSAHGGARVEVQYCVMCHSPGTTDPYSGNTLDFKVMIHKIHTGINLPTINPPAARPNTTPTLGHRLLDRRLHEVAEQFQYRALPAGHAQLHDLPCAEHPGAPPQAANYNTVPTAEACGACHDNVNFATGANHSSNIVANDTQCTTCHGPTSNIDNGSCRSSRRTRSRMTSRRRKFQYLVNSVTFTSSGGNIYPVVNFSVVDPTNSNAPYNILTAAPLPASIRAPASPCAPAVQRAWRSTSPGRRATTPIGAAAATAPPAGASRSR